MPRGVLIVLGLLLAAAGGLFALQGSGLVTWPAESFMLHNEGWILNGLILAFVGVALVLLGLRRGR